MQRQKNITHGEEKKNQSIKTDSEQTQTNEIAKTVIITVFHMFKQPKERHNMLSGNTEGNFRK